MKRILSLTIAFAVLMIFLGCEEELALQAPDVSAAAVSDGAVLRLSWAQIADADGYYIYADGEHIDTVESTTITYDVETPASWVGVSAYAGEDTSAIDQIDCAPEVTENITVYGLSDPATDHPSGLAFTTAGVGVPTSVVSANYDDLDYIFDDDNFASLTLMSPNAYDPAYNDEKNMAVDTDETDFDAVTIADAPGSYNTQTTLAEGAVYALFMDQDDDDWDATNDYFGKMKIESISGSGPYTAVITVAYQTITGLRWLVTD